MTTDSNLENGIKHMDTSKLPSNSYKNKESKSKNDKKVEKAIEGEVIQKKKGVGKQLAELFVGDDAKDVGRYLLFDVFLPAAKSTISDLVSQGVDRFLFGSSSTKSSRISGSSYTSYGSRNRFRGSTERSEDTRYASTRKNRTEYTDILFRTRDEAEAVFDKMLALIDSYDVVSVADFNDLVGITGEYTDEKFGWSDLADVTIVRKRDGYLIDLDRPKPLD